MYPIPIEERRGNTVFALTGDWTQSDRSWSHYYEKSLDSFLPLANDATDATVNDAANETYEDGKATRFHQNLLKSSLNKMTELTKTIELKIPEKKMVKIERLNKAAKEMQEAIKDLKGS